MKKIIVLFFAILFLLPTTKANADGLTADSINRYYQDLAVNSYKWPLEKFTAFQSGGFADNFQVTLTITLHLPGQPAKVTTIKQDKQSELADSTSPAAWAAMQKATLSEKIIKLLISADGKSATVQEQQDIDGLNVAPSNSSKAILSNTKILCDDTLILSAQNQIQQTASTCSADTVIHSVTDETKNTSNTHLTSDLIKMACATFSLVILGYRRWRRKTPRLRTTVASVSHADLSKENTLSIPLTKEMETYKKRVNVGPITFITILIIPFILYFYLSHQTDQSLSPVIKSMLINSTIVTFIIVISIVIYSRRRNEKYGFFDYSTGTQFLILNPETIIIPPVLYPNLKKIGKENLILEWKNIKTWHIRGMAGDIQMYVLDLFNPENGKNEIYMNRLVDKAEEEKMLDYAQQFLRAPIVYGGVNNHG